jgi:preprotein translocase subunit SecY
MVFPSSFLRYRTGVPDAIKYLINLLSVGEISWFSIIGLLIIAALIIGGVVFIQEGQRRIPVQYAKRSWPQGLWRTKLALPLK